MLHTLRHPSPFSLPRQALLPPHSQQFTAQVYNKAFIRLTTHKDKASGQSGISAKDLDFARFCDSAIGDDDISTETGSSWGADLTAQISEPAHLPETADPPGEGK